MDDENMPRYEPKKLNERHKEILKRSFLGQKSTEIAKDLQISRETVRLTKHSRLGQDYLWELERQRGNSAVDVGQQLKELAPEALAVLKDALAGKLGGNAQDHTRMKAATEVLDRSGHSKVTKIQSDSGGAIDILGREMLMRSARAAGILPPEPELIELCDEEGEEESCEGK